MPATDPGPRPSPERPVLRVLLYLMLLVGLIEGFGNTFRPDGNTAVAGFAFVVAAVALSGLACSVGRD